MSAQNTGSALPGCSRFDPAPGLQSSRLFTPGNRAIIAAGNSAEMEQSGRLTLVLTDRGVRATSAAAKSAVTAAADSPIVAGALLALVLFIAHRAVERREGIRQAGSRAADSLGEAAERISVYRQAQASRVGRALVDPLVPRDARNRAHSCAQPRDGSDASRGTRSCGAIKPKARRGSRGAPRTPCFRVLARPRLDTRTSHRAKGRPTPVTWCRRRNVVRPPPAECLLAGQCCWLQARW